ncbi:hypothetical protein PMAYCL1PPCAC_20148, partial [Pristionchus mayeri]
NDNQIPEYLGHCMGRRLKKAIIFYHSDVFEDRDTNKLLKGIAFDQFKAVADPLTDRVVDHILETIQDHSVLELTIVPGRNLTTDPAEVLLKLSASIRSLCICQQQSLSNNIDNDPRSLFDAAHIDWALIIPEMMSKKMDKLFLRHCSNHGTLTLSNAHALRKSLPALNKKVWFATE